MKKNKSRISQCNGLASRFQTFAKLVQDLGIKLLIVLIVLLSACTSNAPKANKNNDKIVGVWEDENSTMTYTEDSKWYGQWDTGINREGHWEIKGDTLWMYAENGFTVMAFYKILKMTEIDFEILSLEKDSTTFHKTRVR